MHVSCTHTGMCTHECTLSPPLCYLGQNLEVLLAILSLSHSGHLETSMQRRGRRPTPPAKLMGSHSWDVLSIKHQLKTPLSHGGLSGSVTFSGTARSPAPHPYTPAALVVRLLPSQTAPYIGPCSASEPEFLERRSLPPAIVGAPTPLPEWGPPVSLRAPKR